MQSLVKSLNVGFTVLIVNSHAVGVLFPTAGFLIGEAQVLNADDLFP